MPADFWVPADPCGSQQKCSKMCAHPCGADHDRKACHGGDRPHKNKFSALLTRFLVSGAPHPHCPGPAGPLSRSSAPRDNGPPGHQDLMGRTTRVESPARREPGSLRNKAGLSTSLICTATSPVSQEGQVLLQGTVNAHVVTLATVWSHWLPGCSASRCPRPAGPLSRSSAPRDNGPAGPEQRDALHPGNQCDQTATKVTTRAFHTSSSSMAPCFVENSHITT